MKTRILLASGLAVLVVGSGLWWVGGHRSAKPSQALKVAEITPPTVASTDPDSARVLHDFVKAHGKDLRPTVQDAVGQAEIRLGYVAAHEKNFVQARTAFLSAKTRTGTGVMDANFGGVSDQAAYQAAVCLVGQENKTQQAHEFRQFIKDRPLSPLCRACWVRLHRMGVDTPADNQLFQTAIAKQEAHIRFETSVCGPKAIAEILTLLGRPGQDYKALARVCGTTDTGTTIEGIRRGLQSVGLASFAYRLNRSDFSKVSLPAVYLSQDHYLVVTQFVATGMVAYDSRYGTRSTIKLPDLSDPDFTANVIVLKALNL